MKRSNKSYFHAFRASTSCYEAPVSSFSGNFRARIPLLIPWPHRKFQIPRSSDPCGSPKILPTFCSLFSELRGRATSIRKFEAVPFSRFVPGNSSKFTFARKKCEKGAKISSVPPFFLLPNFMPSHVSVFTLRLSD